MINFIDSLYQRKYHDKIAFFLKVDLFQHWRSSELACLILHMEENKFARNQVVFKEGDASNCLYFISKGEIEVKNFYDIISFLLASKKSRYSKVTGS